MPENGALDKLAAQCGIEPGFWEITGQYRETSPETKRLLLGAMGVAASNSEEVGASLAELEREEWKQGLPPMQVAYTGRPVSIEVALPENSGDIRWQLVLEDGSARAGTVAFETLQLTGKKTEHSRTLEKRVLVIADDLPWGYHSLMLDPGGYQMTLAVTPGRCWLPEELSKGEKQWGLACQLYLLRSACNWGIGDFRDLQRLMEVVASKGAQLLGINPIHSMFISHPEHASPYSPSHRSFLNVLYIDVTAVSEAADCRKARQMMATEKFQKRLAECRANQLVEYEQVAELKLEILREIFLEWQSRPSGPLHESFEAFKRSRGEALRRASIFEALYEKFRDEHFDKSSWRNWPAEFQNPQSPQVQRFAAEHKNEVEFYSWLQWLADEQLKNAVHTSKPVSIGLYGDLAVGSNPDGAEAWSNQEDLAIGVTIGAPPDPFSREGQNWGLPPYNPRALRRSRYAPFLELIRANMRHRRALRIDHAMALQHLYWVPEGHSATQGAYVGYPFDDLLGLLSLESHRNRCLVVAEDLGTVPEDFRRRIAQANMLSYRVLFFERTAGANSFIPPSDYPKLSVAVAANHDLPTLRAWWEGADIELKLKIGLIHEGEMAQERQKRAQEREQLLAALRAQGLVSDGANIGYSEILRAVHAYLSRTGSVLAFAQLAEITGETEPVNIPGTVDAYPNWRRRLSISLEQFGDDPEFSAIAEAFCRERKGC